MRHQRSYSVSIITKLPCRRVPYSALHVLFQWCAFDLIWCWMFALIAIGVAARALRADLNVYVFFISDSFFFRLPESLIHYFSLACPSSARLNLYYYFRDIPCSLDPTRLAVAYSVVVLGVSLTAAGFVNLELRHQLLRFSF